MLPKFWHARASEPEAPPCPGVSQIRAAEQEAEADPVWLFAHHWTFGSLKDNCQGRSRPVLDPVMMWESGRSPSSFLPHLRPLSLHLLCLAYNCMLPLFPISLSAKKCGFLSLPTPPSPNSFLVTEFDQQLYKWWALLNLLPQLHPKTREPPRAFPHKRASKPNLGMPPL